MTYDNWKTTEPASPYDPPEKCETCGHRDGDCDCPCCHEPCDGDCEHPELHEEVQRGK